MAKPILSPIGIFDSVVGTTVYFNIYTTSNQVSDYIYSVYDSQSNRLLFSGNGSSDDLNYSVTNGYSFAFSPNAALTNRAENYYLQLKVKLQGDDEYGEESAATTFYCKDKPVLSFANIRQDRENIVELSSGIFTMSYIYVEDQGETLKNYQYKFYDSNKSEIESSSIFYGAMSHSYSVTGLQNNQTYYIRGIGETKNGFNLDTGFYTIKTSFSSINNGYALEATNDYKNGLIKVTSHFISSDGEAEGKVTYIPSSNNDYSLDLTGGGTVTYSIPDSISVTNFNLKFIVKPDYSLTFANLK